ncbi:hypothetical protein [Halorientalis halophila]|uniref:hypothetical protein n=1 Tax=Halorientalis halophila TaxID=3108499 RepID=UPI00300AFDF4
MHESPRRRVLRSGGALLAGGLTVGLGGCLQDGDDGESTTTDDGDDTDDSDAAVGDYADWLPAPAALNTDHYRFVAVDTAAVLDAEVSMESSAFTGIASLVDGFEGVELADLSKLYLIDSAVVAVGDVGGYGSTLEDEGVTATDTLGEFDLYESAGGATAVSGDAVIRAGGFAGNPAGRVETIVEAKRGAIDRYTDVSEDCRTLVAAMEGGSIVGGRTREAGSLLDGLAADGVHWSFDGNPATYAGPFVFESESAVDVSAVERLLADEEFFRAFESPTVTSDGRVAVVEGTTDASSLDALGPTYDGSGGGGGGSADRAPQIAFSFDYEARGDDVGLLSVRHEGGDTVRASELRLRGAGILSADALPDATAGDVDVTETGARWPAANTSSELDSDAAVSAGDQVAIAVTATVDISVVWESEDGDSSATLSRFQGPDA